MSEEKVKPLAYRMPKRGYDMFTREAILTLIGGFNLHILIGA
jgi:hypothetical protein